MNDGQTHSSVVSVASQPGAVEGRPSSFEFERTFVPKMAVWPSKETGSKVMHA